MSKSTPLNQIPPRAQPQDDLMLDDDATVQEVLDQIAQSNSHPMQHQQQPQQQQMPPMAQMPPQQMYSPDMLPQVPSYPQNYFSASAMLPPQQHRAPLFGDLNNDLKAVVLVAAICFVVQVLPVEKFVYNYIAIEHIPYSAVLIKAALAAVLFFFGRRFI